MPFDPAFPPAAEALLQRTAPGEPVVVRATADLAEDGRFGRVHCALTASQVVVISQDAVRHAVPVATITHAAAEELYGSGRLVVRTATGEQALARYTRTLAPEFAALARAIVDRAAGKAGLLPEMSDAPYCPRCSAPLPERGAYCPLCVPRGTILRQVLRLVRPHRTTGALVMVVTLVGVAVAMAPPLAYRGITDRVIGGGRLGELPAWAGLILGALLISACCRWIGHVLSVRVATRVMCDLQDRLHEHLTRLTLAFHGRREAGELVGRVMHDTQELEAFLKEGLPFLLVNALMILGIAVVLLWLDARLALIAFLPVPLLLLGGGWFWRRLIPLFHRRSHRRGRLYAVLGESLRGIREVKALSQEARRAAEFRAATRAMLETTVATDGMNAGFFEVLSTVMQLGTIGVWFIGARGVVHSAGHHPSLGTLMAFAGYLAMFYGPLQWFAAVLNWMTGAFAGAERIFQVLEQRPEDYRALTAPAANPEPAPSGAAATAPLQGHVTFDHVGFSYERGREVLHDISFTVRAGEMVGLVGRSGAGKSTIIGLLCRFHAPTHGQIRIDDQPLETLALERYRRSVGIVLQDPFLFQGSILENIRYGRPEATFAEVVEAAKAACCHEFILEKEDGYDTVVGEGGAELSGGERQRLSIARAILHDPRILILDEATSAVDSETEQAIQAALARLVRGRTTIAIAHRLATLRNADRLVVIDDGRVIEQGTHDELLARPDSRFATMVRLQTEINQLRQTQMLEIAS